MNVMFGKGARGRWGIVGAVCLALAACNHSEEPPMEVKLPIIEPYLPVTKVVERSDEATVAMCREWHEKTLVVNSKEEIPQDDLIGFSTAYTGVNFEQYTLLLHYKMHRWDIDTYYNYYVRNTVENTYDWTMRIGVSTLSDDTKTTINFTRFGLLVRKLPADADVRTWISLSAAGMGWDD